MLTGRGLLDTDDDTLWPLWLLFDLSADGTQVFAECGAVLLAGGDELREAGLLAQAGARAHEGGLSTLGVADRGCGLGDVPGTVQRQEQHAVVIGEHKVFAGHPVVADPCTRGRVLQLPVQPLGAGGQCAPTEDGQVDVAQFAGRGAGPR